MASILIIDDERDFADMLKVALTSKGFQVAIAKDGAEGMSIASAQRPRVIITDILMPNVDGIEAIREIKRLSPETRIIAMSGGHERGYDYLGAAGVFGADVMLQKPFRPREIVEAVERLLQP